MAINTGQLTSQNEKISIRAPLGRTSIAVQTGATNAAGAAIEVIGSIDDVTFTRIATLDPADGVTINATLTGVSKFGIVPLAASAFEYLGVRRTDANGGVCTAKINIVQER